MTGIANAGFGSCVRLLTIIRARPPSAPRRREPHRGWISLTSAAKVEGLTTDEAAYAALEADVWSVPRLVVTGITSDGSTFAVTTVVRGDPESKSLTVLSTEGGCVEVRT